ncbi:HxlR family transcriptional regulator [Roseiarcus fermentans]|uniref:HxlR family transcriptional regulator n=1 Tax=Roseiarcus fermentans TaxID=1473586 RepID=A0A366FRS1_9HYPH|nr:helix-turn-helix domain-containing protein [Roseiarcus fermentans]RBP16856.1 HxlR family transcriptional regulator [Roseiarcus fermentans]
MDEAALVKTALFGDQVSGGEPPPPRPDPYARNCPTRLLLDRIGDRWTVLVLGLVCERPRRFNSLRRDIEGLTQKMLSQTLKAMERDGLIARTVLPTAPVSVEYAVTPLGRTLCDTLEGLQRWARDHIGDVQRAQRRYDETR